ncbi:protein of unknown function DUF214 [Pirellula staleyi DSM 6068]|uniref:ABC3 transporter permease protein domain-containing protein n=1 Tax=Pirellula staleyi (strain ATCC 27377 / DSM 6068 / ICPB 4128) TaxID=530564 RepID=D2QYV5_PIRSD|nr:FtsX-like permease family protein [Pirellula staleyi]ADB16410.1 protein of unknown function DUF214 [Pirellula staleyi DSM 6068]
MSLRRYTVRAMQQRPGRTILTVLSIVIGVAAVVAVSLVTSTTRRAYAEMFATVNGRTALEVRGEGGAGFSQDVLAKVAAVDGVSAAVPLLKRPTRLTYGEKQARLEVLGIDPKIDNAIRDFRIVEGRQVEFGDEIVLEYDFAQDMGINVGDSVKIVSMVLKPVTVVGLVKPQGSSSLQASAVACMTIGRAQTRFNPRGRKDLIDAVQIALREGVDQKEVQSRIELALADRKGVYCRPPVTNTQLMQETLMSSEQGLRLASAFSLLLSAFIILNTFMMNVGERRRHMAIMRAVGATGSQLMTAILVESLLLGLVGTIIGLAAGYLGAQVVNQTLARVLEFTPPPTEFKIQPYIIASAFGLGMSLIGAFLPAWRAGKVSALEGLSRVSKEDTEGFPIWSMIFGFLLAVVSGGVSMAVILGKLPLEYGTFSAVGLQLGLVLMIPLVLVPLARMVVLMLRPFMRVEAELALRQVLRHRGRSTLTIGVLFVAGSTGVGMANSILDNVKDVRDWSKQAIVGDYFIRALMPDMGTGLSPDLPDALGDELQNIPAIKHLDRVAFVECRAGEFNPIVVTRQYDDIDKPNIDLVSGDRSTFVKQLHDGEIAVSSVLAQRMNLTAGSIMTLETLNGPQQFRVAALVNEYSAGGMVVLMQRDVAHRTLGVEGVDAYVIQAEPAQLEPLKAELQALCKKYDVLLHSHAAIGNRIDTIVGGIDGCLWALVLLGFVVAAFGVVNTLTMNVLEQTRELGLLRIVAMTCNQVRKTIIAQALIMGGVGIPPGIVVGVLSAYVMNMSMMPVFGHPVEFNLHPTMLLTTLVGSLAIILVASWIPAHRATQVNVVEALHYE